MRTQAVSTWIWASIFSILEQLDGRGAQSVGELAASLGIRHSSVSQTRRSLEEAGLVESDVDPEDGRSRLLRLSVNGRQLVRRLKPLWRILNTTSLELDKEAGGVIAALDRLDRALERLALYDRVKQKLAARKPP
jgi:DNA-binding MarR family transcriptional regulator